ncbi:hypothetical protein QFC21_000152 [Naganishia friedmannii]|uniref:Uncharacterized protein n=1 Tax=Naganishia friedmannii TaxID=89922 RepID=A0ACC2WB18_9TREE|nr:hypothetical protein QFC21_000152 [Naganishia friedmannii]
MSSSTGARLDALVTEISTMNDLARKAVLVIDEEFKALEKAYAATFITHQHDQHARSDEDRHSEYSLSGNDKAVVESAQQVHEVSPSTSSATQVTGRGEQGSAAIGKAGKYVQVVVDCDSLKWSLDANKRGYISGSTLIDDLSDVIDQHLSPAQPCRSPSTVEMPLPSDDTLDLCISAEQGLPDDEGREDSPGHPTVTVSLRNDENDKPAAATVSSNHITATPKKRFTFLIEPRKMMEKNYPLKKDKARLFLAGLDDCEGCELVHVGFGKKSIEDRLREIDQCAHVFLAVGITSNNQHEVLNVSRSTLLELARHASSSKLTIMRSGGPFDRSTGIHSVVPVDRYLSVQTQVPTRTPAGVSCGLTASHAKTGAGEQRERRSYAPSPQVSSNKKVLTSGEEDDRGVARSQGNAWSSRSTITAPFDFEHAGTRLFDPGAASPLAATWSGTNRSTVMTPFDSDYGEARLQWSPVKSVSSGNLALVDDSIVNDARNGQSEEAAGDSWSASTRASSVGEAERTPTPSSRMDPGPAPEDLYEFDGRAILRKYGKPICAKYHLNNGNCHCEAFDETLHDQIILRGSASKQLALWASDRVCPEGVDCPDASTRTCCFWRHESRSSGGSVGVETVESDNWISVDRKGKPIVSKAPIAMTHVWQPSKSCVENSKLARADFNPLMTIIRQFTRDRHMTKHERGLIGTELKRAYGHDIYRRLRLTGFREYTAQAEKAGLVKMGYQGPSAGWISAA